jgi:aryl-alcohol dehydrogenase-like predicted oxidoreductase
MKELRPLGQSQLLVSPIGLGCWQFSAGKGLIGGFWEALSQERVTSIVRASLAGGINWFDTAEAYGKGASEEALSTALKALGKGPGHVVVATKWQPFFRRAPHIKRSIGERLERLGGFPIDLHQVHNPLSFSGVRAEMEVMADLVKEGKIRTVGVSNFSARMMRKAHKVLAARGIPLVSNQINYSLLRRKAESNGVMDGAKELGITIIAYSPLGQGILTGRHHEDPELIKTRPGPRKQMPAFKPKGLERTRPLMEALRSVGEAHGATPGQVALNWLLAFHGDTVVVIPGASRPEQIEENLGALDFTLNEEELAHLDELSHPLSRP